MKIIDTVTYVVEKMSVCDYLKDHQHRHFMEHLGDTDHSPTAYGNLSYLESLPANRRIYVVTEMTESRHLDRTGSAQPQLPAQGGDAF